jgi:catechol 2,3-dioxygenase-like lactoylglutathione lyase family enzyme
LVLNANGTMVRVTQVPQFAAAAYTVLGWEVADIAAAVAGLREAGVVIERFPGLELDELGVWTPPGGGARVAWFKDPDGNVLSLSQHAGV